MRIVLLTLCISLTVLADIPVKADSYRLVEGGVEREFEVDCAFLVCRPVGGTAHLVSIGDQRTEAGILAEAARLERVSTPRYDLCLYERGRAREPENARRLNRKIRVELTPGADPAEVASQAGAIRSETPHYAPGFVILTFSQVGDSLLKLAAVRGLPGVLAADPLMARKKFKRLIPNDPKFVYSPTAPNYQWHMHNTGQRGSITGLDVNVTELWDSQRGNGVTIAIVDDGLEVAHPDLAPNVNTAIDHDWNDGTPDDPTPGSASEDHGTGCAGVAAARGNNSIGVSGAAPEATLVGLRLIANDTTDQEDAEAIAWRTDVVDISSSSWGPDDDGREFFAAEPLISAAFETGVSSGRGGSGTIYVWAAGNGRDFGDYSNYDGYNNRIETISVGAVAFNGEQSFYSESGANVLVCAPSDNDFGEPAITTTTLISRGSYTDEFGGTSAAAPLVSGVLALVLEKNPALGWRDVQEILVRSSTKVDSTDTGWSDNSAGFHFHHGYGAGMIDAGAAVALAEGWTNLAAQTTQAVDSGVLDLAIPDDDPVGVSHTLSSAGEEMRLEHVQLTVDIDHVSRGNLEIFLTSPSGMASKFAEVHSDNNDHIRNYTFLSVRHWGETSTGNWTVKVADRRAGNVGKINSLALKFYGTSNLTGYDLWASTHIPAGSDASAGADIDGDGRTNFMEYALASVPTIADAQINQPSISGQNFKIKIDTSKTDLTYIVEKSTDQKTWSVEPTIFVFQIGDIQTRRTIGVVPGPERQFFRLRVKLAAP